MTIAWGSLVLLVLLLPGFLFFLGIYWPEKFTREAEQRSPLGHLAAVLVISFLIHGGMFGLNSTACQRLSWMPCVSIQWLLHSLTPTTEILPALDRMFREYVWWILGYHAATSAAGLATGAVYGQLAASGKLRRLVRHRWIYDLSTDGYTYTYVLTNIQHENRILMYKGFLVTFGLQQDGRFSYIILRDVVRLYLTLDEAESTTSTHGSQRRIGEATGGKIADPTSSRPMKRLKSYFVIEGEDIANAVFDSLEIDPASMRPKNFADVVARVRKEMDEARRRLNEQGIRADVEESVTVSAMPDKKSRKR